MKKIIVSIFLLIGLVGTAVAAEKVWNGFPDVKEGSWYEGAVSNMYWQGLMHGYDNGNFGPNDYVTRAQMAVTLDNYDKKVIGVPTLGGLRQENAFLKILVCQHFNKADSTDTKYQDAWNGVCKAQ